MIDIETSGSGVTLTINRPDRRNALNNAMYDALTSALETAQKDERCSSILLTGAGGYFEPEVSRAALFVRAATLASRSTRWRRRASLWPIWWPEAGTRT